MRITLSIILLFLVSPTAGAQGVIKLYGGKNYQQYLGCLTCEPYQNDSLHYTYGPYGSKYSATSIFNNDGLYGSEQSPYSPCNRTTFIPPVLIDEQGTFLGYLTLNKYKSKAVGNKEILQWLNKVVCKNTRKQEQTTAEDS